jgi:RHS repeat-associated protein
MRKSFSFLYILFKGKINNRLNNLPVVFRYILLLTICYTGNIQAQTGAVLRPDGGLETPYGTIMTGTVTSGGVTAWANSSFVITSPLRQDELSNRRFRNVISFYVDEENTTSYLGDFTASVDLKIEYKASSGDLNYITPALIKTVTLDYKKGEGQLSDVRQYIHFSGAEEVKVTIEDIRFPAAVGSLDYRNILKLENTIYVTRYYNISNTPFTMGASSMVSGSDILSVNWAKPANPGNNGVQLEWAWLEDELESNYHISNVFTTASKEKLLNAGATRIELGHATAGYDIPMLYDGAGKLHYRVRGVNIQENGTRIHGPWSAISSVGFSGHETALNWQVTTSFAEEGKHKSVIQYYDGGLRARQTVTKDNTTLNTVTAETLYDHEGRPAIQILPAPGIGNIIAYQKNLNKFNSPDAGIGLQGDGENHADFFDHYFSGGKTPTLQNSINGSAARYYSSLNTEASGTGKNIPDAEGYPYTVTRYTPDGTGRILSQSGVGNAMKMGSGRETKYYYGSPKQEELDALFGTEVGDKSHYFKNMVKDANGQMSVSYVDMHGRTIATALAGEAPANLSTLNYTDALYYPGQNHTSALTLNLLDSNTNIIKGNAIEAVSSLLVPYSTLYNFSYTLTPESLTLPTCESASPVCYECLYDLEFAIIDESGDLETPVVLKKYSNLSPTFDSLCSTPTRLFQNLQDAGEARTSSISFSTTLAPGSYSIRKTLTISEQSLEMFKSNYLEKSLCNKDFEFLLDSVYTALKDVTKCDTPPGNSQEASCTSCLTALGDSTSFANNYLVSINHTNTVTTALLAEMNAAFHAAKKNCDLLCGVTTLETITKREIMLADMMPFTGQYGRETVAGTMAQKYNIFSTTTAGIQPFYKKPKKADGSFGQYLTNLGQTDPLIHTTPATLPGMSSQEFETLFQDKWAEALLPYHPEYQRLLFAETKLNESYNWTQTFHNTPTFSLAQSEGFLFTDQASLNAKDPFFSVSGGSMNTFRNNMVTKLTVNNQDNLSLWQYAYIMAICKNQSPNSFPCKTPNNSNPTLAIPKTPNYPTLSSADKDSIWKAFKGLYLQARTQMMDAFVAIEKPLTAGDENALVAQNYILHFPSSSKQQMTQYQNNAGNSNSWNFWPPDGSIGGKPNLPTEWNTPAAQQTTYTSQCQSYIDMWKTSLQQCPALVNHPNAATILNSVTARMAEICRKGSDAANPNGSSNVAPSTPVDASFRSFEALIEHVMDSLSIARTDICNPFIIEYPKAYGLGRPDVPALVTTIDTCNCSRFTVIKVEAAAAGKNPASLSSLNQYLSVQYGDTLTKPLFDALNRCSELYTPILTNCDSTFIIISAPCGSDPCYPIGARTAAGKTTLKSVGKTVASATNKTKTKTPGVLKMQGGKVVLVPKENQSAQRDWDCPPGYVRNASNECVPELPLECPDGWEMDEFGNCIQPCLPGWELDIFGNCVPPACPDGWLVDEFGNCVPPEEPNCEFRCFDDIICDTTYLTTVSLATPSAMPAFMQCGFTPSKRCYTCTDMQNLVTEFKNYFPAPFDAAPYTGLNNMDSTQTAHMDNLARYINYKTGMNYSWADYVAAIDSADCNLSAGGAVTVICRNDKPLSEEGDVFVQPDPCTQTYQQAHQIAEQIFKFRFTRKLKDFEEQYRAKCMAANKLETFTVSYVPKEYHYTLYYYDQAGNLVKTVPPAGVRPDYSAIFLADVKAKRNTISAETPRHELLTQYRYNSLNQVVVQSSPDGGISKFWYDKLGRLAVSQNAKQSTTNQYSYTLYDELGRITEVGQKQSATAMTQARSQDEILLKSWVTGTGTRDQLTQTVYDKVYEPLSPDPGVAEAITQRNLRNRVSYTLVKNLSTDTWQANATFYTYDIHGNVDKLLQDYRGVSGLPANSRFKHISYRYDLVSGKVNEVAYQTGEADAFYHRYDYDADNRITSVESSRDAVYWEREAAYEYYKHGPLARTILGKLQVQGVDYAYTLQGWLKGVNSTSLNPASDMGNDGHTSGGNTMVARDIFGFGLHYYDDNSTETDYKALGGGTGAFARPNNGANFKSLYNGNIAAMTVNNGGLTKGVAGSTNALPLMYNYQYDQLNRIVAMRAYQGLNEATNTWTPVAIDDYQEAVSYDANGNIKTYVRNGAPSIAGKAIAMDNLGYHYDAGTNQLNHVTDNVSATNYTEDIDGQSIDNYDYDAIGNLIKDVSEGITDINWTVYGKIGSIIKSSGNISYTYDAAGNRITKTASGKTTLYVRDASGNVMSVYEIPTVNTINQKELHSYGSSRLGMVLPESRIPDNSTALTSGFGNATIRTLVRGEKIFELSNHLGNVLATISDKKIQIPKTSPNHAQINYYTADVVMANDYAPFGMELFGRTYSAGSSKYRYGFNGKEKDTDIHSLTAYDYGFRIYNPSIGKFLSVDPLTKEYPWYTPYQFAGNMPIWAIDLDGLEEKKVTHYLAKYNDGSFYVLKTDVDIDLKTYYSVRDKNTGKESGQLAKTSVRYEYLGESYEGSVLWEDRMNKGLKASAAYDYTDDASDGLTSMKQKFKDDVESAPYVGEMYNPFNAAHTTRIVKRDLKAPDNAKTLQDLAILDVVGDILEKRLGSHVPKITPSHKLGNKVEVYENPGHHDPKSPNFNKSKSVLPSNHEDLYGKSVMAKDGNKWSVEGSGKKKVYHRFQNDGNGNWHWNGSTNSKKSDGSDNAINANNVPIEIKRL